MAGKENIGGFFYSLGVETDRGSFARGMDAIKGLVDTAKAGAAAIGAGFAIKATVDRATADLNLSEKLGVSINELDKMRTATSIVGANFHSITGEMDALNKKFRDLPLGDWDEATATALAQLKAFSGQAVGYDELKDLDPVERVKRLLDAAGSMQNKGLAGDLLGKIMGQGLRDMFIAMNARGFDFTSLMAEAGRHTYNTAEAKKSLDDLRQEAAKTKSSFEGIWTNVLGTMSENWLVPGLTAINTWVGDNKDNIEKGIGSTFHVIGEGTGKVFNVFKTRYQDDWENAKKWVQDHPVDWEKAIGTGFDIFTKGLGIVLDHAEKIAGHIATIFKVLADLGSDIFAAGKKALSWAKNGIEKGIAGLADWSENSESGQALNGWLKNMGLNFVDFSEVEDGIISPGGHVTQVAPDDWVVAFKNLEDLAGAFHPADGGNTANVTISQTFNVGGNVRDIPATIREQAYKGTTSALSEMFSHTGKIMQLMPATR